jgi:histidinol dehydrogenase
LLARPAIQSDASILADVSAIVDAVRTGGDQAIRELTQKFDRTDVKKTRVTDEELAAAASQFSATVLNAIDLAIANVRRFHEQQVPQDISIETMPGVCCERRSQAIESVGLYVPAGSAPLPSAAIMLAVPSSIAGCPVRVMCTPPQSDGCADAAVLVAAARAGITKIYKIGGAQAIAAMAYGTESVPKVSKIFGPGNAWVTSAKSMVSGDPYGASIDMPAGPSEVLVLADGNAQAEFVAADLLSQAEHGPDSQVVLVTTSIDLLERVQLSIASQLKGLSRASIATQALTHSRAIIVQDMNTAVEVSNQYAPEHLILQCEDPRDLLPALRNAGSIFVGPWAPESVGDYCSGTNHVLPTYGFAKTYSGLGVDQFMRQTTVQELTRDGLVGLAESVIALANLEGLDAHAKAVSIRLGESS